ncbi:hypothetical protein [Vallitalea maricola]|uniref:Uncharacterized protein n=1 Tax=Vallitalea maricola TaxID=3074433 RepID=A0ACB5ULN1_9FIRM|nr:hypothetical protein AN2V17_27660 [Vallitalea sp. AN17-2]
MYSRYFMLGITTGIVLVWTIKKIKKYRHERKKWKAFVIRMNAKLRAEQMKA